MTEAAYGLATFVIGVVIILVLFTAVELIDLAAKRTYDWLRPPWGDKPIIDDPSLARLYRICPPGKYRTWRWNMVRRPQGEPDSKLELPDAGLRLERSALELLEQGDEVLYFDGDRPRSATITRKVIRDDANIDVWGTVLGSEMLLFEDKPPGMIAWQFVYKSDLVSDYLEKEE